MYKYNTYIHKIIYININYILVSDILNTFNVYIEDCYKDMNILNYMQY